MDPALHKAATQGDVQSLRELLAKDPKILSCVTPQKNTALHIAARLGHRDLAEEILKEDEALLIMTNADGDTPLHVVARAGKVDVAELLIGRALQWTEGLETPSSPLMLRNKTGNTPLHEAVTHGRLGVAARLLEGEPWLGHAMNEKMESPLHIAARQGLITIVRKIVDQQWVEEAAEVQPSESSSGSAVHQAVLGGHIKIMEILLDTKSDLIKFTDKAGNNALHYAAQKNNARIVSMLLTKDPSLAYVKNSDQQSPLHIAAQYGSADAIKELLRQCPDAAELVDSKGRTALHTAIVSRKVAALQSLLRHVRPEEIVNRADDEGNTPLHVAAIFSRIQSALLLLQDRRVDPCVLNKQGETARSAMERRGKSNAAEVKHTHTARSPMEEKTEEMHATEEKKGEMDTYELYMWKELKKQEAIRCKKHQLPPVAPSWSVRGKPSSHEYFELSVETYTLVATLIATVTFAAMFTLPGGTDQTHGTAILGRKPAFKVFIVSNTVAMCSSIIVVFCFIWAWRDPVKFKLNQMTWGHRLTVVACLAMIVSLLAAVYLTVAPESRWLAYVVIAIGGCTPVVVVLLLRKDVLIVPM